MSDVVPLIRRRARRLAAVSAGFALIPLTMRAVPAIPRPLSTRMVWHDSGGDYVTQTVGRRGFDRYGYVHQVQVITWVAPTPAALADVRANRDAVDLPSADAWKPQFIDYGNNHVVLPHGLEMTASGLVHTVPYSLMAVLLAMPGTLLTVTTAWRRLARPAQPGT
jgi:hypothetical protein